MHCHFPRNTNKLQKKEIISSRYILKNTFIKSTDFFQTLGWAFYLACSWTWCIGMFLPVILIRDYGPWGWLVFAIPNILGATVMGYLKFNSNDLVEKHKTACTIFSIVTILFQIYFIGWISTIVSNGFIITVVTVLLLLCAICSRISNNQLLSAFIIWTISIICFISVFNLIPIEKINLFKNGLLTQGTNALLYLTPICFFGFSLCPYLDLTFHKARLSNTTLNSKIAFTIGFCFLFLILILFTFFYAQPMAYVINKTPYLLKDQNKIPMAYIYVIVFHMIIQAGFTTILHLSFIFQKIKKINLTYLSLTILSMLIYIVPTILNEQSTFLGISINEIIYRAFMAFYSLIAPVYVFLFMASKNILLNKRNLLIYSGIVLTALPFYAIAFLGTKWNLEILSLIGLSIVLLSKVFIKSNG